MAGAERGWGQVPAEAAAALRTVRPLPGEGQLQQVPVLPAQGCPQAGLCPEEVYLPTQARASFPA